jgi:putative tricarboxylic transport membrane protein
VAQKKGAHEQKRRRNGNSVNRISGLVVFLLAFTIFWQGRGLSIGSLHAPGAGFFPLLIAAVLLLLSLFLMIKGGKSQSEEDAVSAPAIIRMLLLFAALVAYFLLLEYLGFVIVSFLLMSFLFLWVGRQRWYVAGLSAVVCIGCAYLLFEILLKSNLPRGVFGF